MSGSEEKQSTGGIITDSEALEILSSIARGTVKKVTHGETTEIIIPTESERLRAVKQLHELKGGKGRQNALENYQEIKAGLRPLYLWQCRGTLTSCTPEDVVACYEELQGDFETLCTCFGTDPKGLNAYKKKIQVRCSIFHHRDEVAKCTQGGLKNGC